MELRAAAAWHAWHSWHLRGSESCYLNDSVRKFVNFFQGASEQGFLPSTPRSPCGSLTQGFLWSGGRKQLAFVGQQTEKKRPCPRASELLSRLLVT